MCGEWEVGHKNIPFYEKSTGCVCQQQERVYCKLSSRTMQEQRRVSFCNTLVTRIH